MKLSSIAALHASLAFFSSPLAIADANKMDCVTEFDANKDYFPDKIVVEDANTFSVTYHNSYKIVTNIDADKSYVLYQCGAPPPPQNVLDQHDAYISVPVEDFGVHYTTFVPYMELLGKRNSIATLGTSPSYVFSPCFKERIDANLVTNITDWPENHFLDEAILTQNSVPKEMPFFIGVGTDNILTNSVEVSEYKEPTSMAVFEYIKFFSTFFNLEKEANEIYQDAKDRITCVAENANQLATDAEKPVVLWGSYSSYCEGWNVARSCPNFYCTLADTCAAEILVSEEGSIDSAICYRNYMTTEEFVAYGKDADVWIYSGDNLDTTLADYAEDLKDFKSLKNDKIYDITGQTIDGWYADRIVEPDTLLQDFCSVVGRENPVTPIPHKLTFLRHSSDASAVAPVCTDQDAPMARLGSQCFSVNEAAPESSAPLATGMAIVLVAIAGAFL